VTRPGVKVRARNGFFATPPSDTLLTPTSACCHSRAREEIAPAIQMFAGADEFFQSAGASPRCHCGSSNRRLHFKENGTVLEDSLQIVGLITDSAVAGDCIWPAASLQFTKPQLQAIRGDLSHIRRASRWTLGTTRSRFWFTNPQPEVMAIIRRSCNWNFPRIQVEHLILSRQVVKAAPEAKSDPW